MIRTKANPYSAHPLRRALVGLTSVVAACVLSAPLHARAPDNGANSSNFQQTRTAPTLMTGGVQPEVSVVVSCLAGNGRVDLNIVNTQTISSVYRLELQGLTARERTVNYNDWGRMPITGRPAGSYFIQVSRDGTTLISDTININCSSSNPPVSTPEVTLMNACRSNNGYVLFQLVNPTAASRPYVIEFDGVPNRSTTAAAYGQAVRATTGRPDGTYNYLVRTGSTIVDTGQVTVACDFVPPPPP